MSISCSCDLGGDIEWYWRPPEDFTIYQKPRKTRCFCCRKVISSGDEIGELECFREPRHEVEENIYGDEVPLADKCLCEECFGIFLSAMEAGYCINLEKGESMKYALAEMRASE